MGGVALRGNSTFDITEGSEPWREGGAPAGVSRDKYRELCLYWVLW